MSKYESGDAQVLAAQVDTGAKGGEVAPVAGAGRLLVLPEQAQHILLGDGKLNYGRENIIESYYNLHAWRGLYYALNLQFIEHPGYNKDRGPVLVESVRMHVDF